MTILQMQHELLKRGKLEDGEETSLSEWNLRLRLVCVIVNERKSLKKSAKQVRVEEEEARRSWIAQCRAYEDEDDDESEPMEIVVTAQERKKAVC
jgi:hypothetical protein